jgi:hypothetical protein
MELSISRVKEKEFWPYIRRRRAAGNMACIEATRNANKILVGMLNVGKLIILNLFSRFYLVSPE